MATDENEGKGKPTLMIFEDVAQVLDNTEPADRCVALEKVFKKREKAFRLPTALRPRAYMKKPNECCASCHNMNLVN